MKYAVQIDMSLWSIVDCLDRVNRNVENIEDWMVSVNGGGICYGLYLNFDLEEKELTICNGPLYGYDESLYLDDIIDEINKYENEDE